MADKDKKKLKVILKLPKTHLKSPATAPLPAVAQAAPNSSVTAFPAPSQFSPSQDHRKNVSHHAAGASSSALQAHNAANPSTNRSSSAAASGSVAASSSGPGNASNADNNHQHTPLKKRKFKVVEQSGALGVGALVVGAPGSEEILASVRDGGSSFIAAATSGAGGRAASPAPVPPPAKKSHKKQVKSEVKLDGGGAGVFLGAAQQPQASTQPLSKTLLEGVLDKLQKKDTYGVFAEPVDAAQVPDYYDVIKEPMDFGTMRKKINKGSYKSVEAFEVDICLICSNAMRYNGPETIYYKQARTIREMAKKSLEALRSQLAGEVHKPVSHKKKPPPPKKSHAKKPTPSKSRFDGGSSDFASGAALAADGEGGGWSNSTVDAGKAKKGASMEKLVSMGEDSQSEWALQAAAGEGRVEGQDEASGAVAKAMGPKDGRRPLSTDEYHRNTYKPRLLPAYSQGPPLAAVGGELRQLVPVGQQVENSYAKSVAQFGAILPPKAWRLVARELQKVLGPNVPFGPGWVGEQEAPLPAKKQLAARNSAAASQPYKNGVASTAASTLPVTTGQVAAASVAPSHSSSSGTTPSASPGNSSAVSPKVSGQTGADRPPCGKALPVYSSGALGRPFIPSSKSSSGSGSVPNARSPQNHSSLPVSGNVGTVPTSSNGTVVASSGAVTGLSSHGVGPSGSGSVSLAGASSPGQPGGSNVQNTTAAQPSHVTTTANNLAGGGKSVPSGGNMFNFPSGATSTASHVKFSPGPLKSSSSLGTQSSSHSTTGAQQTVGASSVSNYSVVAQISTGSVTSFSPGIPKSSLGGGNFSSYASGGAQTICMGPSTLYPTLSSGNNSSYSAGNAKSVHGTGAMPSYSASGVQSGLGVGSSYSSGVTQSGPTGGATLSFTSGPGKPGSAGLSMPTFSSGVAHPGVATGIVMNFPAGVSQPAHGGNSSLSSGVSQPSVAGLTGYSSGVGQSTLASGPVSNYNCGASQSAQGVGLSGFSSGAGQMGNIDINPDKVLLARTQHGGMSSTMPDMHIRSGSVDETKNSAVAQNLGVKQSRSMDGASAPGDGLGGGRLVWPSLGATQEQQARAMNIITGGKAFPREWTSQMVHDPLYSLNFSSGQGGEDAAIQANVQKWAHEQVMGLAQQQGQQQVQQQAQQQSQQQAQQQAHLQAQQQAHLQAHQQAHLQAQQQAHQQAHLQAQQQAHLQAKQQAHQQAQLQAQQQAQQQQAQLQAQQQAQQQQAQLQAQQQAQQQAQLQAQQKAQQQAQLQVQQQAQQQAQLQAKQQAQQQAQLQVQQQAQQQAQLQAKQQAQQQGQQQAHQHSYQQAQQQAEAKKNICPSVQVFHSQPSQLKLPPNLPQILPQMYEYNMSLLQSAGMIPPLPDAPVSLQQTDPSSMKAGGSEPLGSLPLHSQSSLRPIVSLQQSIQHVYSQQRSMPPDLNVALQSPTALQSPPSQQTPAAQTSQQPDLQLQL